ncbi:MAG: hypothetical protein KIT48_11260 [Pseudolabrys sp.]|nr:hypothetical protein [Pseudolabrys sp.]
MAALEFLEGPAPGWFPLDVMQEGNGRKGGWVALMIDVDPDELKHCATEFPALFYVHPKEYQPGPRKAQQRWLSIPGKHRSKNAAWDALQNLIETRH